MRRASFRPRVRLYAPPEQDVVRPFDDPWRRFHYLSNLKPQPSKFKEGDVCIVLKKDCKFYRHIAKVRFASGDHIECIVGRHMFVLKQRDLKWLGQSKV